MLVWLRYREEKLLWKAYSIMFKLPSIWLEENSGLAIKDICSLELFSLVTQQQKKERIQKNSIL